jgi:hypothetical protein
MTVRTHVRLGEILVKEGFLTDQELRHAISFQKTSGKRLGEALVTLRMITEEQLAEVLGRQLGIPFLRHSKGELVPVADPALQKIFTAQFVREQLVLPLSGALVAEAHLVFVMLDGSGHPTPVPEEIGGLFGTRVSTRAGEVVRYDVGEVTLAADVRGDGPALLLIHGYPLDRSIWAHQVATLAGWRRIAPDLRGRRALSLQLGVHAGEGALVVGGGGPRLGEIRLELLIRCPDLRLFTSERR